MLIKSLKILQHNVLAWNFRRRIELCNYYMTEDPDIILLNATGRRDADRIKIFNYNVHQKNANGELHAGIAIAIRRNIEYKILEDFNDDVLGVQIDSNKGKINIITYYRPPKKISQCSRYCPLFQIERTEVSDR